MMGAFMRKLCKRGVLGLMLVGATLNVPSASSASTAQFADLNWLVGLWRAQNGKDAVEEMYLPAKNNEILGTFTAVTDGKVSRYELRSLREQDGQIIFQELAYGPELKADRPVATRVVTSTDAMHINFDGLSIVRTGENSMTVTISLQQPTPRIARMDYTRVMKLTPP